MNRKRDILRFSRGLRFRLTASYALFFAVLLLGVATLFRERLERVQTLAVEDSLEDRWAALKGGYVRIDLNRISKKYYACWYYDDKDPDEAAIVLDIKKVYVITDAAGSIVQNCLTHDPEISTTFDDIGVDANVIKAQVKEAMAAKKPMPFYSQRTDSYGDTYQIRGGVFYAEGHGPPFYVAIGVPVAQQARVLREFTLAYVAIIPAALILGSVLGWIMAGRALKPVKDVAQAAQRISGSNLSMRIPTREADDELDYLILTFNRMIERLQASFNQIKQFSTDVSHELRTPITGIRGQLEVALFTAKTTDQYREAMFNALQDIDRLSQIVRALLLLSQAESGQLVLQKSRMSLCDIVSEIVDQFQIPAEEAGIHLRADLPEDCYAEVDRVQIERMLTNLLSNALKFTPRDGDVTVTLRRTGDRLEMTVADTGQGIPTEYLPHIFDRFYRVPVKGTAPGPDQGLGLGLSFVAWIVRAHNGKIDVASTPGQGTRFTISIPASLERMPEPVGAD
jgi:heavy metal sensor kinase